MLPTAFTLLAALFALTYFYFINREISASRTTFKTLPVSLLSLAAFSEGEFLLAAALLLSSIGDFFLSRNKDDWFLAGLSSFLIGHLFYIVLFALKVGGLNPNLLLIAPLISYALFFGGFLIKRAGKYRFPVIAYLIIICSMGLVALHLPTTLKFVTLGALVFIISDSLLALRMFIFKNEKTKRRLSIGVWITYIAAQILIFVGFTQ